MALLKKPMKGCVVKNREALVFPLLASPKLDGIHAIKRGGKTVTLAFKDIPNDFIREGLDYNLPEGAEGEIVVGDTFQDTDSAVMSVEGEPDYVLHMFDLVDTSDLKRPYDERLADMEEWFETKGGDPTIQMVPTILVDSLEMLDAVEKHCLDNGYEGTMLRATKGPYKEGKSTEKQGYLLKIKPFADAEAVVIGFEEQMQNNNPVTVDATGRSKRSSHKANKVGKNTLGKLLVASTGWKMTFAIGTGEGLTDEKRKEIWDNRADYLGAIVKYKFQEIGSKDKPRIPIMLGFRSKEDMNV